MCICLRFAAARPLVHVGDDREESEHSKMRQFQIIIQTLDWEQADPKRPRERGRLVEKVYNKDQAKSLRKPRTDKSRVRHFHQITCCDTARVTQVGRSGKLRWWRACLIGRMIEFGLSRTGKAADIWNAAVRESGEIGDHCPTS